MVASRPFGLTLPLGEAAHSTCRAALLDDEGVWRVEEVSIGEFARRSRLSVKALRLYDELGVLAPARVDTVSGYRYYDPSTGQFLTVDPLVDQTGQPYAYTGDDPVNSVDMLGLCPSYIPGCGTLHDIVSGLDRARHAVASANDAASSWLNNYSNNLVCNQWGLGQGVFSSALGCGANSSNAAAASFTVTCTFSIGGVTSGPYDWGNLETLLDHFGRHGPDFGSQTPEEYAQQASSFLEQMVRNGEIKIDPEDGAIRVYDPESNTFAAYNPNGTSRTIFKPDEGQSYWDKQPGEEPWFGGE